MATVANFHMIHNPNVILPAGEEFAPPAFSLPGVAGLAVLLFRYRATDGRPSLKIRINNNERVTLNLVANGEISFCSFHETILPGQVNELNNILTATVTGTGTVAISDVMVLYQMTV